MLKATTVCLSCQVNFNPDQFPDPIEWPPQMFMLINANSSQK